MLKYNILLLLLLTCNINSYAQEDSTSSQVLICHSYDPETKEGREKVKNLFVALTDSLLQMMKSRFRENNVESVRILPERIGQGFIADSFAILLDKYHSSIIVDVNFLDVYFEHTDTKVEKTSSGKNREAQFDICSKVLYTIYRKDGSKAPSEIKQCEFFTSRSTFSGFLSLGPDIVGKKKYAFKMLKKNMETFFLQSLQAIKL